MFQGILGMMNGGNNNMSILNIIMANRENPTPPVFSQPNPTTGPSSGTSTPAQIPHAKGKQCKIEDNRSPCQHVAYDSLEEGEEPVTQNWSPTNVNSHLVVPLHFDTLSPFLIP